jgi:hypothetical protein
LIIDNIEADVPVSHDLLSEWLQGWDRLLFLIVTLDTALRQPIQ